MKEGEEVVELDMTPILLEDLGMRFPTEKSSKRYRYGLYQCQYCGKEFEGMVKSIKSGNTTSCGCKSQPHGLSYHPLYHIWKHMRARCINPKVKQYKDYGGRGIQVCERWLDIKNFIEDMYPSWEEGLSIDRIDVNGNYEPDNCRWATNEVQRRNTRDIQSNNTSGYRGVCFSKKANAHLSKIYHDRSCKHLGIYPTALEAAKAYERYVRIHNLEHNFTPTLTEEEIERLNNVKSN